MSLAPMDPDTGQPQWRLMGFDAFDGEYYDLGPLTKDDWLKDSYPDEGEARAAAQRRLRELERTQPSSSSGGQGGIQDHVYIVHPDGREERVYPDVPI